MENIYIQLIDEGKSTFHHIPLKSTITLGKAETCDIKLKGKDVASVHALIEAYDSDSIFIRSLSPKNRVMVNGKAIEKAKLIFSDIIKIGNAEFQIKKVDVHESFPGTEQPETPPPQAAPEIFKTPISDDEIEQSLRIPEESSEPRETPAQFTEPAPAAEIKSPPEKKEPAIVGKVVKSSRSLRVKEFWWDVILSDNLYPLTNDVTIGAGRKNNYILPPNGLPKRFPLFIFENMQPYLVYNRHIEGFVASRDRITKLHEAKGKLDVTSYRKNDSKLKLGFEDSGEALYGNIKFAFEFVQTPAPALRDKPFSKMDRLSKATLFMTLILAFLFLIAFWVIPMQAVIAKKPPEHLAVPGAILTMAKVATPKPQPLRPAGEKGSEGKEGEGARAPGPESKRGKSTQGPKGPTTNDLIKDKQIGVLLFFKTNSALRDIARGGGGGDLNKLTGKLRAGLPGETEIREGKGLKGSGTTGGGGTFVGSGPGGLGKKGTGLGSQGTGRADWGKGGEARVSVKADALGDEAVYQGNMDPAIIERIIKNNLGYLKWCYEKELNTTPELGGKITVDFIIGVDGLVTSSKIKATSMNSDPVESCISRRIKTLKFPSPGSGIVQVFYPFFFRVAGGQ